MNERAPQSTAQGGSHQSLRNHNSISLSYDQRRSISALRHIKHTCINKKNGHCAEPNRNGLRPNNLVGSQTYNSFSKNSITSDRRYTMAQIVRIYTSLPAPNPDVADYSFDLASPPVIRVNVEASLAEAGGANGFAARIIVRDMVTGIVAAPANILGAIGAAPWTNRNETIEFTLPPAITAVAAAGNLVEVVGIVRVGAPGGGSNIDSANASFVWSF